MGSKNKPIIRPCPACGRDYKYRRASGRTFALCEVCRQADCVVCGKKVPLERGRKNTCCDLCAVAKTRDTQNRHYTKRIGTDPDFNRRHHARAKEIRESDPEKKQAYQAQQQARYARRKSDPQYQEAQKKYHARHYAANAAEIQQKRAEFWARLPPEQKELRRIAQRLSSTQSKRRFIDKIKQDPVLFEQYKKSQQEAGRQYRRQKALNDLMQQTQELLHVADTPQKSNNQS